MTKPNNIWIGRVHAAMLKTGSRLTLAQMKTLYGVPLGGVNADLILENAVTAGWFEARGGKYSAVERLAGMEPTWRYLDKLSQVPSVFLLR